MTAPRFEGQLPDGTFTTDIVEYGRAWNELGLRVAEKLGAELMGCDPFILHHRRQNPVLQVGDTAAHWPTGWRGGSLVSLLPSISKKL